MRELEEKRELLYVIRTMDVLMSSGVGLEAALHTIGRGGYGIISEDFSSMMKRLRKGTGGGLDKELKSMMKTAQSAGYKRLLNTLYTNVTQNTDLVETLKKQGARMEEDRTEEVEKYIEAPRRCARNTPFYRHDWSNYFGHCWLGSTIDVRRPWCLHVPSRFGGHQQRREHGFVHDTRRHGAHRAQGAHKGPGIVR